ncbi:4-(cytidine 5'-diphospho)-2-C-methyl-D-erythritol kinase [Butyrivibrio sp. AE2032]|uniref:4-(cytidine 5'-diphospho)-2-C-methyl-D-erythritol kinase n=1 Tax=Butyrivibrio sp. AE2032 TaxID=1458463 RepID=UPI000555FC4B|nr:4-(cytidine 5'-diphospho)-2-C-methyl-D-erythritol kinase [Butyrivibrio sp. AE2032]
MEITRKAYAKINLGLDVTGKRDDGYHLVRMIMQNIDLYDTLTYKLNESGEVNLSASAEGVPTDDSNLICKVAHQLQKEYGVTKGVDITLEKRIPVAAGMAGGSTDGAATYLALNDLWDLGLTKEQLCKLAVKLGADIPYCIIGGTALSEGIGEVLTPIKEMPACHLVIAKPAIAVSTGWVYTELDSKDIPSHPDIDGIRDAIEGGDLKGMCDLIGNVLEDVTTSKYSIIKDIEKILEDNGAIRAFMTGSGPTVFAIYDDKEKAQEGYRAVKESGLAPELFLSEPIDPNK